MMDSSVDGKVCQSQAENPLIPTVQICRATSKAILKLVEIKFTLMTMIAASSGLVVTSGCIRPPAVLNNGIMGMIGNKYLSG
jgi:hypothetical protein